MIAQQFIEIMRRHGLFFFLRDGRVGWYAPTQPTPEELGQAQAIKAELITFLQDPTLESICASSSAEEAIHLREERAGILEYDGGLASFEAELRAGIEHPTEE